LFKKIISLKNLLGAWEEFKRGKSKKPDVQEFYSTLEENIFELHKGLRTKTYRHSPYHHFRISDPKPRDIHKACVRDRLLHHALHRVLYTFFDKKFIHDTYSSRVGKGVHKAMCQFFAYAKKCSQNHTKTVWVLKCDIRKFFASVDHAVLFSILENYIHDKDVLRLLHEVVGSFTSRSNLEESSKGSPCYKVGLPLGNLTSQLLVNIYMNEFDQFVKHKLKVKYYIRYADDFVFLSQDRKYLEQILANSAVFLRDKLKLQLHPNKVSIQTFAPGVDFLGWIHFPDHRVLRTSTKRRMLKRTYGLEEDSPTVQSYVGMLGHGNGEKLKQAVKKNLIG